MNDVTLIGIDLGKHSFHLHGRNKTGHQVLRKKLTRSQMLTLLNNTPPCTVVMEARAGAHWIARQVMAMGHQAKLISPAVRKTFCTGQQERFCRCAGHL